MRGDVKAARTHAVNKLTQNIKKLQKKKGSDAQKAENARKAEVKKSMIDKMKKLNPTKVVKFALGNTLTWDEVSTKFKNDIELKCLVTLAEQKPLKVKVTEWRKDHSDWQALAAFLMQHTGKRFNPKDVSTSKDIETKPKFKHQHRVAQESHGAEGMLESDDMDTDGEEDEDSSYHSDDDKAIASDAKIGPAKYTKDKQNNKNPIEPSPNKIQISQKKRLTSQREHLESNESYEEEDIDMSSDDIDYESGSDNSIEQVSSHTVKAKKKENDDAPESGEMVVKKLKLDELAEAPSEDISFLFKGDKHSTNVQSTEKRPSKKKDSFFLGRGSDDDESDRQENGNSDDDSNIDEDTEDNAKRVMHESTFMGSLAGPAPKFKDYAAIRKEKRGDKKAAIAAKQRRNDFSQQGPKSRHKVQHENRVAKQNQNLADGLHPSWEASRKRKLEQSKILPFQGKKKSFDDIEGNGNKNLNVERNTDSSRAHGKPTQARESLSEVSHPSWEASRKRQLEQAKIHAFAGKKKTFDD